MSYLLAAEADQIQDFVFRASHLREVVGGSQLLSRFCREVPQQLLPHFGGDVDKDIIISDGGSFRVLFSNREKAISFGAALAEIYRQAADGTLTVAEPIPVNGDFPLASQEAEKALRQAKRDRHGGVTTPHVPYVAFCASCGVGLTVRHGKRHDDDPRATSLCKACQNKATEADVNRLGDFLTPFLEQVAPSTPLQELDLPWQAEGVTGSEQGYDPRNYVAYLVADGNDMGKVFDGCNEKQMRQLSQGITQIVYQGLAAVATRIMRWAQPQRQRFVPVLPLIIGGDDLFALLPAPWALDAARCFSQVWEDEMGKLVKSVGLVPVPTISTAVVVCKANYPYFLAHQAAAERLEQVKQVSKALASRHSQNLSAMDFELIIGSQLVSAPGESRFQDTLRPYWIKDVVPRGWGLPLSALLEQRLDLQHLPNKRRSQLRTHFGQLPSLNAEELPTWSGKLERLLGRIGREEVQRTATETALEKLGGPEAQRYLYAVERISDKEYWQGHGLPDLLDAWDFARKLDESPKSYEEV
ncbi:MAG: hypothetical protein FJ026_11075 [Chloroflexi bacterium]|nr:hypothetical protein [Chloroflexota bacterium]